MQEIDFSESALERQVKDGRETVHVSPEVDPKLGITGRYNVMLSNPEVRFTIENDENARWKSKDAPIDIDPDFITWDGNEIERYYR